ncbi:M24 family metallopeptidase, partial [Trichococcus sp.]
TSQKAGKVLVPGNVITNEPGIYLAGLGGVRIEDDLVIRDNGNEILTHSPKELIIL